MKRRIVTFTTDFGTKDPYVAEMKAVILSGFPEVQLVDISHEVPPQDVVHASLVLWRSFRYFPRGTLHMAIVDPGVGTKRAFLIGTLPGHTFLAPDNGLLSPIVRDHPRMHLVSVSPERRRMGPARTFDGREWFAPCAVRLLKKEPLQKFGKKATAPVHLPEWKVLRKKGSLEGRILVKDHFGNAITNIRQTDLHRLGKGQMKKGFRIRVGKETVPVLSKTYGEGKRGELLALFGSAGLLELAVRDGNASEQFSLRPGDRISIFYGKDETKPTR